MLLTESITDFWIGQFSIINPGVIVKGSSFRLEERSSNVHDRGIALKEEFGPLSPSPAGLGGR